jgi:hypothetical protein
MADSMYANSDSVSLDSVPLDGQDTREKSGRAPKAPPLADPRVRPLVVPGPRLANVKSLIAIFVIFLFVVSSLFTNSVIGNFSGAMKGRSPTAYGTTLQGIFLVLFFVCTLHMINIGVL